MEKKFIEHSISVMNDKQFSNMVFTNGYEHSGTISLEITKFIMKPECKIKKQERVYMTIEQTEKLIIALKDSIKDAKQYKNKNV
jgi:hypothetical protein